MSEWISVKERLPRSGEVCLVYGANAADWARKVSLWEGGQWFDDCKELPDVTHWMPLPDPPVPTLTVKEALREAISLLDTARQSTMGRRELPLEDWFHWSGDIGMALPRLRAALESEEEA